MLTPKIPWRYSEKFKPPEGVAYIGVYMKKIYGGRAERPEFILRLKNFKLSEDSEIVKLWCPTKDLLKIKL